MCIDRTMGITDLILKIKKKQTFPTSVTGAEPTVGCRKILTFKTISE